jgi:hypothetical protein
VFLLFYVDMWGDADSAITESLHEANATVLLQTQADMLGYHDVCALPASLMRYLKYLLLSSASGAYAAGVPRLYRDAGSRVPFGQLVQDCESRRTHQSDGLTFSVPFVA